MLCNATTRRIEPDTERRRQAYQNVTLQYFSLLKKSILRKVILQPGLGGTLNAYTSPPNFIVHAGYTNTMSAFTLTSRHSEVPVLLGLYKNSYESQSLPGICLGRLLIV